MDIATKLAEFAVKTKYPDIPEEVIDFTKGLTLKTVAGMLAGATTPSGRKFARLIKERRLPEEVGAVGSSFKTSLWEAVFLNAFFAHASELEDDRFDGGISWDITVIALLFPLAEKLKLTGRALLEALAVGLEVHTRTCLFYSEHLGLVQPSAASGPAVGAARALGLGVKETASALGLCMAGVPLSILNFGTDAHYLESSYQSLQGIIAAELAKVGMTSNPDLGTFLSTYLGKERVTPEKIVEGLGEKWFFSEIWVKKYPCCFLNHRQIDAIIELMRDNKLTSEDIKTLEVHMSPADEPCNRPEPKTEQELQFSFHHVLGCAMLDGDVNLKHFTTEAINDPKLKEARSKVKTILHSDWSPELLMEPARLTVKTTDGKELSKERKYPIGSAKEPLSMPQFRDLYIKFARGILSDEDVSKTADALMGLEKLSNLGELMNIITMNKP